MTLQPKLQKYRALHKQREHAYKKASKRLLAFFFCAIVGRMNTNRIAFIAFLALTACATITADSDQTITITTKPTGAACDISNSAGHYHIATTPGSITVPRAYEPLLVTCALAGYTTTQHSIEAKTRGRAYGNILLLGIPALVDASTGNGYEYAPDSLTLELPVAHGE